MGFFHLTFLPFLETKLIKMMVLHSSPCPRQIRKEKISWTEMKVYFFYNKVDSYFLKIRFKSIKEFLLCLNGMLSCFFGNRLLCSVLRLRMLLIFFRNRTMEDGNFWHLAMNDKARIFLFLRIQNKLHHSFRAQQGTQLENKKEKGLQQQYWSGHFFFQQKIAIIYKDGLYMNIRNATSEQIDVLPRTIMFSQWQQMPDVSEKGTKPLQGNSFWKMIFWFM